MKTKRDTVIWIISTLTPVVIVGAYRHESVAIAVTAIVAVLAMYLITLCGDEPPP